MYDDMVWVCALCVCRGLALTAVMLALAGILGIDYISWTHLGMLAASCVFYVGLGMKWDYESYVGSNYTKRKVGF